MAKAKKPKKAEIQGRKDALAELLRSAVLQLYIEDRGGDALAWRKTPGWEDVNNFGLDVFRAIVDSMPEPLAQKLSQGLARLKPRMAELNEENRLLREEIQRLKEK